MKNKLYKPIILSLMALSLVGCDSNEVAVADKDESSEIVEEVQEEMDTENKPAEDDIDKSKLKDTEEDKDDKKEEAEKEVLEVSKEEEKKDDKEVAEKPSPEPEKETSEEDKAHEKDGKYVSSMIAELKGEPSDYITATAYEYKFEDDKFVVSGSFDYFENPEDYENVEEIGNKKDHKFVINDDTVLQAVGGMADPKIFNKEDFLKYLNECKDTGLALIIFVENGVATSVSISS